MASTLHNSRILEHNGAHQSVFQSHACRRLGSRMPSLNLPLSHQIHMQRHTQNASEIDRLVVCSAQQSIEGIIEDVEEETQEEDPSRRGFRSYKMEGCEFLVAETPEGLLTLSDSFVIDSAGTSERPTFNGDIPTAPKMFQTQEWASEYPGNALERKDPKRWVFKVYLIAIASIEPYTLSLDEVYCVDAASRTISRCAVIRLAPVDANPADLRLRIRERLVTIDVVDSLPNPEQIHQAKTHGIPAWSRLEMEDIERDGGDAVTDAQREADEAAAATAAAEGFGDDDLLYDEETLKDFLVDVDDENDDEFEEFDEPEM